MKGIASLLLCVLSALVEVHSQTISIISVTTESTSLTISWALEEIHVPVTGYSISYSNTDTQCFTDTDIVSGIAANEICHTLTGLQEDTEYTITVTAILTIGGTTDDDVTAMTLPAGEVAGACA